MEFFIDNVEAIGSKPKCDTETKLVIKAKGGRTEELCILDKKNKNGVKSAVDLLFQDTTTMHIKLTSTRVTFSNRAVGSNQTGKSLVSCIISVREKPELKKKPRSLFEIP